MSLAAWRSRGAWRTLSRERLFLCGHLQEHIAPARIGSETTRLLEVFDRGVALAVEPRQVAQQQEIIGVLGVETLGLLEPLAMIGPDVGLAVIQLLLGDEGTRREVVRLAIERLLQRLGRLAIFADGD